jgi:hypothetical protein
LDHINCIQAFSTLLYLSYRLNIPFKTNATFAGRSAKRRMK